MSWEIFKLSEVSKVVDSLHQTPKYSKVGSPMVRVTDVKGGYLSLENTYKVNQEVFSQFTKNHKPKQGDIIITRVGSYGLSSYVNTNSDFCLGQNTAVIIPEINNKFLYYVMSSNIAKNQIEALITGSSYKSIGLGHIRNLEIPTPSLQTQKRIADILSAYDDLIENNIKRIKLLEQAAQNIYKEWFVNLRFPGHENIPISEETALPEGFEEKLLSDLVSKITDGTHDSPKPKDNGFYLVTGKNIINGFLDFSNAYFISKEDHDKVQKRSFLELGDILYSNIGTIGSTTIVDQDFKYSCKNVIIFKPLEFHSNFLYCFLTNNHTKSLFLQGLAGSSQKFISLTYARGYKGVFPSTDSIVLFHNTVKDFFKQKKLLHIQNQKLKAARDILLPRLMNRTIEV